MLNLFPWAFPVHCDYGHISPGSSSFFFFRGVAIRGVASEERGGEAVGIKKCTIQHHMPLAGFTELLFIVGAGSELKLQHKVPLALPKKPKFWFAASKGPHWVLAWVSVTKVVNIQLMAACGVRSCVELQTISKLHFFQGGPQII